MSTVRYPALHRSIVDSCRGLLFRATASAVARVRVHPSDARRLRSLADDALRVANDAGDRALALAWLDVTVALGDGDVYPGPVHPALDAVLLLLPAAGGQS